MGERGYDNEMSIFKVRIPNCMKIVEDNRPIIKLNVPESKIACTKIGVPPYFVEHYEDFEVVKPRMGGMEY